MSTDAIAPRQRRNWTPWLAGFATVVALGVLAWAALAGRGDGSRDATGPLAARGAATANAVQAVALSPALDPGPAGRLGGLGSAVLASDVQAAETPAQAAQGGVRRRSPTRRPRPRQEIAPDRPSYRAIGPRGDDAPPPPAPAPSAT